MHVAVVGGGVAGLTAALELADLGARVTLLEGSTRFGGQVSTIRAGQFVVEEGAEGFIARSEAVPALCRRLGLGDELVAQSTQRTLGLRDGRLEELREGEAAGLLGIQVEAPDLGRGLVSLRGGMGALVDALVASLEHRAEVRLDVPVVDLRPDGSGWGLRGPTGCRLTVDAVILALPSAAAAPLLAPLVDFSALLHTPVASLLAVSLAYARAAVAHPLDATGLVRCGPSASADPLRACSFSSTKFTGRAPDGWCLLRAFFDPGPPAGGPDADWYEQAHRVLAPVLGLRAPPDQGWVSRWPATLPRYRAGHDQEVAELRQRLWQQGRLEVAGAAFDRGGVDGAVRSGLVAAHRSTGDAYGGPCHLASGS